ncbi:hypothetical protein AHAS_Ahas01G0109900 [Arachis hypogaea]
MKYLRYVRYLVEWSMQWIYISKIMIVANSKYIRFHVAMFLLVARISARIDKCTFIRSTRWIKYEGYIELGLGH